MPHGAGPCDSAGRRRYAALRPRWEYGHVAAFAAWFAGYCILLPASLRSLDAARANRASNAPSPGGLSAGDRNRCSGFDHRMAEPKTRRTDASVRAFLAGIDDATVRKDCQRIARLMQAATGASPSMWGSGIIGFGSRRYRYASGREGDWPILAFAPRKQNIALYVHLGGAGQRPLLQQLGKHKTGKACLYIKRLADIDETVLQQLLAHSAAAAAG